jgi:hypothetical protein
LELVQTTCIASRKCVYRIRRYVGFGITARSGFPSQSPFHHSTFITQLICSFALKGAPLRILQGASRRRPRTPSRLILIFWLLQYSPADDLKAMGLNRHLCGSIASSQTGHRLRFLIYPPVARSWLCPVSFLALRNSPSPTQHINSICYNREIPSAGRPV